MKIKPIVILFVSFIMLFFASCTDNPDEPVRQDDINPPQDDINLPQDDINPPQDAENLKEIKDYLWENFRNFNIDGSTSMTPLHESLRIKFGSVGSEARHSRTVDAFDMLISGENHVLLSVDFDDELLEKAEASGIKLVQTAITREAFVFLINKNNPVKSLTTEQIKGIYSGEITNWSEVGGDDAPISAFQRNSDSGSQIRMVKFMGDTPLMETDVEYVQGMGEIVMRIASYDEGKYSIAYNMYTFTEKQYENDEVILLNIDGVTPSDDSIFDDSYPLVIYNYLYYDENNARVKEFAENLYAYLMSDEGQKLISDSGYVTLNKIHDRNVLNSELRYFIEYDYEVPINFYNEEKSEFYDTDGQGNLLVYYNYTDYVLRGSDYINHTGARDFLTLIFDSSVNFLAHDVDLIMSNPVHIWEGVITFHPYGNWFNPTNIFNFKYNEAYFYILVYNIDEDKYTLESAIENQIKSLMDNMPQDFVDYIRDYEASVILEIEKEELSNLLCRGPGDWSEKITEDGNSFEYFTIFK